MSYVLDIPKTLVLWLKSCSFFHSIPGLVYGLFVQLNWTPGWYLHPQYSTLLNPVEPELCSKSTHTFSSLSGTEARTLASCSSTNTSYASASLHVVLQTLKRLWTLNTKQLLTLSCHLLIINHTVENTSKRWRKECTNRQRCHLLDGWGNLWNRRSSCRFVFLSVILKMNVWVVLTSIWQQNVAMVFTFSSDSYDVSSNSPRVLLTNMQAAVKSGLNKILSARGGCWSYWRSRLQSYSHGSCDSQWQPRYSTCLLRFFIVFVCQGLQWGGPYWLI
jgi:hypothetical protein